jgi:Alpha-kinase family
MYNPRAKPKYGAFKQTIFGKQMIFGHVDRSALWNSTSVAIKQCFYTSPSTGTRVLYDKHSQLTKLTAELNCLRWASALMGIVYNFIEEHKATNGLSPSFLIPEMAFVKSALAISETDQEVFLLEEVIDEEVEGPFIKYIGNGSVKPYNFLKSEDSRCRGEFLSFCQHLQYLKTKGLAFVGDFQGKHERMKNDHLLTQLIISRWTTFTDGSSSHNITVSNFILN